MKKGFVKKFGATLAACALATTLIAGCSSSNNAADTSTDTATPAPATSEDTVITVGATPAPHAEILEQIKDILADEGYTLDIVEFNDYILPNTSLESGDLDANYFQHITYLNDFNAENGTHLVSAAEIHYEPFGLYAGQTTSLDDLKAKLDGGEAVTIAVPNDTTNEARALLLLEQEGIIELDPNAGITATILDVTSKPENLTIQELEAAQLPRVLTDVDAAVINGNYAIEAGLSSADALATESSDGDAAQAYVNVLAVREGTENDPKIQALVKALQSQTVKDYIDSTYDGAVVPLFEVQE